jgi:hypothetical protein
MSERRLIQSRDTLLEDTLNNLASLHYLYQTQELGERIEFRGGEITLTHNLDNPTRYTFLYDTPIEDVFLSFYDIDIEASDNNKLRSYKSLKPGLATEVFIQGFLIAQEDSGMSIPTSRQIMEFEEIFAECCKSLAAKEWQGLNG